MTIHLPFRSRIGRLLFVVATILLQQCTSVRLIQEYDEITDTKVTEMQEDVAAFFVKMDRAIGTPDTAYEKSIPFYDAVKTQLDVLTVRAKATPKSDVMQNALASLSSTFDKLEQYHRTQGFSNKEELVPLKSAFDNSFAALIQFNTALKNRVK
jgi:hypothetical protein